MSKISFLSCKERLSLRNSCFLSSLQIIPYWNNTMSLQTSCSQIYLPYMLSKQKTKESANKVATSFADLDWPPKEEKFVITFDEKELNLWSVKGYSEETDYVKVQLLETLKTRAKDDCGKVYWAYTDKNSDCYKKHSILDMRPSVSLAKNIKRKEPVFALLNREIIESITATRYPEDASIWDIHLLLCSVVIQILNKNIVRISNL